MGRRIEVLPYEPGWKEKFAAEAQLIIDCVQLDSIAVHHIGSTAIPGIWAKPVIDILLVVKGIEKLDQNTSHMQALGYQPRGEYGIPGRRFFSKDLNGHRAYHLHAYQVGNPEIGRYLRFRDYLIAHPDQAQAYSRLKIGLADRFTFDPPGYNEAKTDFILGIDEKAKRD